MSYPTIMSLGRAIAWGIASDISKPAFASQTNGYYF
jgi:hypothetical protein